jgi:hypothetical protein
MMRNTKNTILSLKRTCYKPCSTRKRETPIIIAEKEEINPFVAVIEEEVKQKLNKKLFHL